MAETAFSFIHCADLHLDSPFEGLQAVEPHIAGVLREATFKAFDNVIALALRERVDFIIVAGDVYDGADRSLRAQLKFRDSLERAAAAGIRCFVAHGNHDPLSGWEANLKMPPLVHRFGGPEPQSLVVPGRHGRPLACIYGLSYPVREVRDNLAARFRRQAGAPLAIGVLHCNVGGNPDHDNYAPCTLADLAAARLDYWALGHVHAAQVLMEHGPCVVYAGNTQGRNVRESGPKGCYLVRVDAAGRLSPEFVATDTVRWFARDLDLSPLAGWDEFLDLLFSAKEEVRLQAAGRAAILRLRLCGRTALHSQLQRLEVERDLLSPLRDGEAERPDFVWVESLGNRTRPTVDLARRRAVQDFVGDFLRAAEAIRGAARPGETIRGILRSLPESQVIAADLEQLGEAQLLALLDDAEIMGLDFLVPEEG